VGLDVRGKSQIFVAGEKASEDQLMRVALEAGATIFGPGREVEILWLGRRTRAVAKALEAAGHPVLEASIGHGSEEPVSWRARAGGMLAAERCAGRARGRAERVLNFDIDEKEMEALER